MVSIERALRIALPAHQSAFLWGPRKTGKSTYLRSAFPDSLTFDLLQTDLMLELAKRPALLRERLLAAPPEKLRSPVILDEVQKVPQLLDEVHWLIENRGLSFILCGSSARKLKRGGVNLLGGRAWRYENEVSCSAGRSSTSCSWRSRLTYFLTSRCRKQPVRWSLTMPTACMKA